MKKAMAAILAAGILAVFPFGPDGRVLAARFWIQPARMEEVPMIPVRPVVEQAGGTIAWNGREKAAYLWQNGIQVKVLPGETTAERNGEPVLLFHPPVLENGALYLSPADAESLLDLTVAEQADGYVINASPYDATQGWKRSSPEKQGMDGNLLADMVEEMMEQSLPFDSALVLKNGYLVSESYFYPYHEGQRHAANSCTKSILSALCGIAIERGYIKGIDQKVADFYPELEHAFFDPYREQLTVRHLLTLTAGLNPMTTVDASGFLAAEDRPLFVLSQPFSRMPGTRFVYDNWATHVLAGVLNRATGRGVEAFAQEVLFGPLGITDYTWTTDANGLETGGFGLALRPEDLLKFGYLYLMDGKWNGMQVVPQEWVRQSTRTQTETNQQAGYGYLWWTMTEAGAYYAHGYGGQYILVVPEQDLVVVLTGDFSENSAAEASFRHLTERYLLPACENASAPERKESMVRLAALQDQAGLARTKPVPLPPPIGYQITGKTYRMEDKAPFDEITFWFDWESCVVRTGSNYYPVGVDGTYRFADHAPQIGWQGEWKNSQTFLLLRHDLEQLEWILYQFTFDKEELQLQIKDREGKILGVYQGKPFE